MVHPSNSYGIYRQEGVFLIQGYTHYLVHQITILNVSVVSDVQLLGKNVYDMTTFMPMS